MYVFPKKGFMDAVGDALLLRKPRPLAPYIMITDPLTFLCDSIDAPKVDRVISVCKQALSLTHTD